jgi:hypothetical protein
VFRATGRMLCELDAEQFAALQSIIGSAARAPAASSVGGGAIDINPQAENPNAIEAVFVCKLLVQVDLGCAWKRALKIKARAGHRTFSKTEVHPRGGSSPGRLRRSVP